MLEKVSGFDINTITVGAIAPNRRTKYIDVDSGSAIKELSLSIYKSGNVLFFLELGNLEVYNAVNIYAHANEILSIDLPDENEYKLLLKFDSSKNINLYEFINELDILCPNFHAIKCSFIQEISQYIHHGPESYTYQATNMFYK